MPVVGGRIADLIAGRFNTIYGSLLIALTGNSFSGHYAMASVFFFLF